MCACVCESVRRFNSVRNTLLCCVTIGSCKQCCAAQCSFRLVIIRLAHVLNVELFCMRIIILYVCASAVRIIFIIIVTVVVPCVCVCVCVCVRVSVRSFLPPRRACRPRNIGMYVFTATQKNLLYNYYNRGFC